MTAGFVFLRYKQLSNPVKNLKWSRDLQLTIVIGYAKARQNRKGLILCKGQKKRDEFLTSQ